MKSIIGKKVGMTQLFNEKGDCLPVTLIDVERCVPVLSKSTEQDGYKSVLVAFGKRKESRTNRPSKGFYDKHKIEPAHSLTEFRDEEIGASEYGKPLNVDMFKVGDLVNVVLYMNRFYIYNLWNRIFYIYIYIYILTIKAIIVNLQTMDSCIIFKIQLP